MNIYLVLFYEFFKTGLFAVGGGMATLPFLYDMADKYTWFPAEIMTDLVAVSESTPGPIGINAATYAGYNAAGIPGGIVASVALVLPAFIIIMLIARALTAFRENDYVVAVFDWLRPVVLALIATAFIQVLQTALLETAGGALSIMGAVRADVLALMIVLFVVSLIIQKKREKDFHPIVYIGVSAAVGILFKM